MRAVVVFCAFLVCCSALNAKEERRFPDDFVFGTATASYQIEGAWDADDKSENIWDYYTHDDPSIISDFSNGDIAADSYHNYKRDVEMMRELGISVYRFSISWSRVLPSGFSNKVSEAGIAFYNNYINEMLKYNIQPMVTMYHWDLPYSLQKLGGIANAHFVEWFEDYARVLYDNFGDRVKHWITFNEPYSFCEQGYGDVNKAPMVNSSGIGDYMCTKNVLLAHGKAYRAYEKEFKDTQGGLVGYTNYMPDFSPLTDSEEDVAATELTKQFKWRIYTDAIFHRDGGWPKELEQRIREKSESQGFSKSRLPEFTDEEIDIIKGSYDFFGLNHYTGKLISANSYKTVHAVPSIKDDMDVGEYVPEEWPSTASDWFKFKENSMYNVIMDVHNLYDNPDIYITENGWSTSPDDDLNDEGRVAYYRAELDNVLDAIDQGANVKGYMAWSLMDNFEWFSGYSERFGLYQVDMEDPERTRTPRKSAYVYKEIVRSRVIDYSYEPDISQPLTIDEGH